MSYSHISAFPRPSPVFCAFRLLGMFSMGAGHSQRIKPKVKLNAISRSADLHGTGPMSGFLAAGNAGLAVVSRLGVCRQDRTDPGWSCLSIPAPSSKKMFFSLREWR